jgi:predicted nucleic acid-binding protein
MNAQRALVLDANILVRATLGHRVRQIIRTYGNDVRLCTPDTCFTEAEKYIADLASHRGKSVLEAFSFLNDTKRVVQIVNRDFYGDREPAARRRIERRDPDDWPIVAVALMFGCPIWTEDQDFFGTGIPTWTTDRVEIYLQNPAIL